MTFDSEKPTLALADGEEVVYIVAGLTFFEIMRRVARLLARYVRGENVRDQIDHYGDELNRRGHGRRPR